MQIQSSRFGLLEFPDEKVIHFPLGLLGFERFQRFVIFDADAVAPMRWLQAVDEPGLAFLVVEPELFFPDYGLKLDAESMQVLELTADDERVVLCLVAVPGDPKLMTINLLGPLVFNPDRRLGKQIVLHDSGYSPRQRLLPDEASITPVLA